MNIPEYDKLAKSLLINNDNGIEKFIGNYITENIGDVTSYEFTMKIADLLEDLAEIIPNITGSFNCIRAEDYYKPGENYDHNYILLLYGLIEDYDGELKVLYKVPFNKGS